VEEEESRRSRGGVEEESRRSRGGVEEEWEVEKQEKLEPLDLPNRKGT